MRDVFEITSAKAMQELGKDIARDLSGGAVVLLSGELGAGKTVFCKGLAAGLGIESEVLSPTFTIMNEHIGKTIKLCHIDAYRLTSAEEAEAAGICEYIGAPDCICAVEWWENIDGAFYGLETVKITIDKCDDVNTRKVTVER
ncbi:MAG: tRNA (adenosine(37)-N6)-threonylcarbamoyltransferase complex ATPase subunit type 1 TsaE [Clostridiales bacterium]|nr:tRNA (adenosine(37)-N6)-threonylcarbamoyltransferase complex ATPase subunit type 1 TsaE [Clostridiales bacterium]